MDTVAHVISWLLTIIWGS